VVETSETGVLFSSARLLGIDLKDVGLNDDEATGKASKKANGDNGDDGYATAEDEDEGKEKKGEDAEEDFYDTTQDDDSSGHGECMLVRVPVRILVRSCVREFVFS
jgi:hypothetical protein